MAAVAAGCGEHPTTALERLPMPKIVFTALLIACLTVSCVSSAARPASIAKPDASVTTAGEPFFDSITGEAAIDFDVAITNRATEMLRVRQIRVISPGMGQYVIRPINQRFHDEIAPGETRTLIVPATAVTDTSRLRATEPLMLRLDVLFETKDGTFFREVYSGNRIIF
jgi:hypothetical protein